MSYTVPAGAANTVGKTFNIFCAGNFDIQQTCTVSIKVKYGALTLVTWTTPSIPSTVTNVPWALDFTVTTATTGASGTVESHGTATIKVNSGAGSGAAYVDGNTTTAGAVNLTIANNIFISITFSANGATPNIGRQRMMIYTLIN
jgi:hypothetical protein